MNTESLTQHLLKQIVAELVNARQRQRMDQKLKERATKFEDAFHLLENSNDAVGLRITAVPVSDDLSLEPLSKPFRKLHEDLSIPNIKVTRLFKGKQLDVIPYPDSGHVLAEGGWNLMLRAVRSDDYQEIRNSAGEIMGRTHYSYLELHCDGIVEFGLLDCMRYRNHLVLFPDHAVVAMATVLLWMLSICQFARLPSTEYMVQPVVHTTGKELILHRPGPENWPFNPHVVEMGKIKRGVMTLPKMLVSQDMDIAALLSSFEHDLVNAGGSNYSTGLYGELAVGE